MVCVNVACAPAASAGMAAVPTRLPPTVTLTLSAAEAAVPLLRTVPVTVIASTSLGAVGVQLSAVTCRSGLGAGVPNTWNSAIWPAGAPVLAVIRICTSAVLAVTGIVTVFWAAGLNV